jgi:predicted DNA-binding transcriptional regulator AlpA
MAGGLYVIQPSIRGASLIVGDQSLPEVWGFAEVAGFLGVSRQRVLVLVNRPGFPAPIQTLASGRIWLASEVREWERQRRELYPGPLDGGEDL